MTARVTTGTKAASSTMPVTVPVIARLNAFWCPDGLLDGASGCEFRPDRRGFGLSAGGF